MSGFQRDLDGRRNTRFWANGGPHSLPSARFSKTGKLFWHLFDILVVLCVHPVKEVGLNTEHSMAALKRMVLAILGRIRGVLSPQRRLILVPVTVSYTQILYRLCRSRHCALQAQRCWRCTWRRL